MRYNIGKALEAVGLMIAGLGLMVGIQTSNARAELTYLAMGGFVFTLGWLLERGKRSS